MCGRVGYDVQLGVGDDLWPGVRHRGDIDPQIVDEIRGQTQSENDVRSLKGEVGGLWHLSSNRLERIKCLRSRPLKTEINNLS